MKSEKKATPEVSVIIPTRNRVDLLPRAVESVLKQTYSDLEVIVVDDASCDRTHDLMRSYVDQRVKYFRLENNVGGAAARNVGIDKAQGGVIAFLDDDDYWDIRKLELQLPLLKEFDAAWTVANYFGKGRMAGRVFRYNKSVLERDDLRRENVIGSLSVFLARAECFSRIRLDENLKKSQDWDLYIRIAQEGMRVAFLDLPLVHINDDNDRLRITTSIRAASLARLKEFTLVFDKHRTFFGDKLCSVNKAKCYLSYFLSRSNKWQVLLFAIKETRLITVLAVLMQKLIRPL